jgi:predicted enzyme related to lactoylglutathione lyase
MASHRSRLACVYIDVPRADYDKTVAFWRDALPADPQTNDEDPDYTAFGQPTPGVELFVQAVGDPVGRIHLDIETDDIEAEVARLVALGAEVVERIQGWVVMRDPVGVIFCVVKVQMPHAFDASAVTWTS